MEATKMENEKTVTEKTQNCAACHMSMYSERHNLFHYIMGAAWYDQATYKQISTLIDCYAAMFPDKPAEIKMLRLINEIEQKLNCEKSYDCIRRNSDNCSVDSL